MTKVLVVDDTVSVRNVIGRYLSKKGHDVLFAETVDETLWLCEEEQPDTIVCDIDVTGDCGLGFLEITSQNFSKAPIVLVAGEPSLERAIEALRLGAFDYLPKPMNFDQLEGIISSAVNHKKQEEEKRTLLQNLEGLVNERTKQLQQINNSLRTEIEQKMRMNSILHSIRNINRSITQYSEKEGLVKNICSIFAESRGYSSILVGLYDDSQEVASISYSGFGKYKAQEQWDVFPGWVPICLEGMRNSPGNVIVKQAVEHCKGCRFHDRHDNQKVMVVRLQHRNKYYGVIAVAVAKEFPFDEEEKRLFIDTAKDISYALFSIENAKDQHLAENKLKRYEELLRELATELTLSEERQRRNIATMLHDGPCQLLTALKIGLQLFRRAENDEIKRRDLGTFVSYLEQAIEEIRGLMYEISPLFLYEIGIQATLEWLFESFSKKNGIKADVRCSIIRHDVPEPISVLVFQIARELLTNISKHARAELVSGHLKVDDSNLWLEVEDDGVGFDAVCDTPPDLSAGGFGLLSVRERLRFYQGELQIHSVKGKGTKVLVRVPIPKSSCCSEPSDAD